LTDVTGEGGLGKETFFLTKKIEGKKKKEILFLNLRTR